MMDRTPSNRLITRAEFEEDMKLVVAQELAPKQTPRERLFLRAWDARYPTIPPYKLAPIKIAMQPVFAWWRFSA